MANRICKSCNEKLTVKNRVIQAGYVIGKCKECRRKEARDYAKKRKNAMKQYRSFWDERE